MALRMPELDGIGASRQILAEFPQARIIALTSFDGDQEIYRALEAGVRGYLLKEMVHTEVLRAIRLVHAGKRLLPPEGSERLRRHLARETLTPRQGEVPSHVARRLSDQPNAQRLRNAPGDGQM